MSAIDSEELPLDAEMLHAITEHQAGRYEQAERAYRNILATQPYHAVANHNLGLLSGQRGQHEAGLPYLLKALSVNPDEGQFWLSYATGLLKADRFDEALDIIETAIQRGLDNDASRDLKQQVQDAIATAALKPNQVQVDHIIQLYHSGHYVEMEQSVRELLAEFPESAFGWSVLGTALQVQGKDALDVLNKTVQLTPDDAEAHANLGNALQTRGEFDAALISYERALQLNPDFAEALSNMGGAMQGLGRLDDAINCYQRALFLRPEYALARFNLGNIYKDQKEFTFAIENYQAALVFMPQDAEIHCNLGNALHNLNRFDEAISSYRLALEYSPTYAMAHGNLGAAQFKLGFFDEALKSYEIALQLAPYDVDAQVGYGQTLEALKQEDAALTAFRRAVIWKPEVPHGHVNLGRLLLKQGKALEAVASYRKAALLSPEDASFYSNLGLALHAAGNADEADAAHQRAIALAPDSAHALQLYADFLKTEKRLESAIKHYQRARNLDLSDASICNALALAYQANGQPDDALTTYREILKLDPRSAIAYCNIGTVLQTQRELTSAKDHYMQALEIDPDFSAGHFNLANCLMEQGQFEDALCSYAKTLAIEPTFREAHVNTSAALSNLGRIDEAIEQCRVALEINPDWDTVNSNKLFLLAHSNDVSAADVFAEHLRFGEQFESPHRSNWPEHANSRDRDRRLRIGFITADFNNHAVAHFVVPVIERLAQSPRLELFTYYNHTLNDFVTERVRSLMAVWHSVSELTHDELTKLILADQIDILIDLSGHTGKNRMLTLARKPAPLQVSWAGYPMTTGLHAVDYYLSDRFFSPPGMLDEQFTEKLVFMPACAPFLPSHEAPPVTRAPAYENNYITFGSFNRANKLSPAVIARWSKLLRAVPNSRMLLAAMPGDFIKNKLIALFAAEGIDTDRLSFHPRTSTGEYMALHRLVDVCLDTFPYTGGTTTFNAAWMGVPTLTMTGNTLPSRAGATILEQLGLEAFVAVDEEDFVKKGKFIADNVVFLATLRLSMRRRLEASAMGQPDIIAKGMENGLRIMWQRWCAGLPAASFHAHADTMATIASEV